LEVKTEGEETSKSPQEQIELDGKNMVLIEAALYVAGRPLELKTLCYITRIGSKRKVQSIARMLMDEYRKRNTALEILELEDRRFVMQLKAEYSLKVRRLAVKPLLSVGPLKTLSYIAYRQPIAQKKVIEARGGHAYAHIRTLREMDLVELIKEGKTRVIKTTEYFADHFGLSRDPRLMKQQLRRIFDDLIKKTGTGTRQENETADAR